MEADLSIQYLMSINMYLQIISYILVMSTACLIIYLVFRLIQSMFNI